MIKPNIRQLIATEALSWIGTPFAPHTCIRGVGCDCIQLAMGIYKSVGLWPAEAKYPEYRLDTGSHRQESQVIGWGETCPWMIKEDKPKMGSAVTFKVGKVVHHVGVMVTDTQFVHCWRKHGVITGDLRDPTWRSRLTSSWGPNL